MATAIARCRSHLDDCQTLDDLRLDEAQAASAYWAAWRAVRARFATRDAPRIPVHWTSFTQRVWVLTGSPRVAVDPICAILNYLYAILEAESRIAVLAVGLDLASRLRGGSLEESACRCHRHRLPARPVEPHDRSRMCLGRDAWRLRVQPVHAWIAAGKSHSGGSGAARATPNRTLASSAAFSSKRQSGDS